MDFGGFSLTGPREANEDSYFLHDFSSAGSLPHDISAFIMVSDGMGGYQGGDVASSLAVEAAQSYLNQIIELAKSNEINFDPSSALAEIVERAHDAIIAVAQERGGTSMGATFVGAFISPEHAWIGHVGDSRAYCIRDGQAIQLTEDHSQVGRMLSQGVLTEEEAQNHPNRNRIERALGFPNYEIEFDEIDLEPSDALLLCSDGVYTVVNGATLASLVKNAPTAADAAQQVVNDALARGTDDNSTTAIAWGFGGGTSSPKAKRPTTLSGAEGVAPIPAASKSVTRTLSEADGVAPIRDDAGDDTMLLENAPRTRRIPSGQRERTRSDSRRRQSYDGSQTRRTQQRARSSSNARSRSMYSAGRTTQMPKSPVSNKNVPVLSTTSGRRPNVTGGNSGRSSRNVTAPSSRLNWRTALVVGLVVIAIAIIALLAFACQPDVKVVDTSTDMTSTTTSAQESPEASSDTGDEAEPAELPNGNASALPSQTPQNSIAPNIPQIPDETDSSANQDNDTASDTSAEDDQQQNPEEAT